MGKSISDEYCDAQSFLAHRLDDDLVEEFRDGDFAENLMDYFRGRPEPPILFSGDRLSDIACLAEECDPQEYAWEKEIADQAVDGKVYGASNAYCHRFLDLPEDFEFTEHPNPDPQTIHGINRQRWYASLARQCWRNQDRRYFDALMEHWDFFVQRVPFGDMKERISAYNGIGEPSPPAPWWQLDCYIRLKNWYWAYWSVLYASQMTPERHTVLLARCLRLFDIVAARGIGQHEHNFTSMQMESLYLWAAALPEVIGMDVWKNAARVNLESSLRRAVFEDGVQWEKSAGYHRGCMRWYGTPYALGQRIGDPWAEEYGEKLRKMAEYLDAVVTPDGNTSLLSDSDRVADWRSPMALIQSLWPGMRLCNPVPPSYYSLWATNGRTWEQQEPKPAPAVRVFPEGGVGVMREGDEMLILDNGPTDAGHSHFDNMTVHYDAFEKPIIVDPGRHIYNGDQKRDWVMKPQSHNLIMPEDQPIGTDDRGNPPAVRRVSHGDDRLDTVESEARDDSSLLTTAFRGYRVDRTASARRTVAMGRDPEQPWLLVVDRVQSAEPHTWTNNWLFPTDQDLKGVEDHYELELESGVQLFLFWVGDLQLRNEERFWCRNYNEHEPARWLRFSGDPVEREIRAFAFIPQRTTSEPEVELKIVGEKVLFESQSVAVKI